MNSKCGVQSKRRCGSHESCVCIVGFPALVQNQHIRELISSRKMTHNNKDDIPLVEFMYLVFTRTPGESYRR